MYICPCAIFAISHLLAHFTFGLFYGVSNGARSSPLSASCLVALDASTSHCHRTASICTHYVARRGLASLRVFNYHSPSTYARWQRLLWMIGAAIMCPHASAQLSVHAGDASHLDAPASVTWAAVDTRCTWSSDSSVLCLDADGQLCVSALLLSCTSLPPAWPCRWLWLAHANEVLGDLVSAMGLLIITRLSNLTACTTAICLVVVGAAFSCLAVAYPC